MTRSRSTWSWRSFVPVVAPVAIGVVFHVLGHPFRAAVLWALAGVTLVLVLAGVPVHAYVARFAAWVAHVVGVLATGVVGLILVGAGGLARMAGRDPLTPRSRRGNGWQVAAGAPVAQRLATAPFGLEPGRSAGDEVGGGGRALGRTVLAGLGSIVALLLVDLGIGLAWEAATDEADHRAGEIVDVVNFTGSTETVADVRAQLPAMAAYPWADEYFREIQLTRSSYWPFTETRPLDFTGKYVNIDGWSRRSYSPEPLAADAPVVWMFGGSTTWGEGQRDDYTIASYLARIAEEEGLPVEVVNYGQRGWTHFQEMVLFEQLLADGPTPDLALFYDGANEINAQSLDAKGVPTHTYANQYAELITGGIAEEFIGAPPEEPGPFSLAWKSYLQHSAIQKAVGRIRDVVDPPAGAVEAARSQQDDEAEDPAQEYVKTVADARNAVEVYERGRRLTGHLADDHGVDVAFFWQPVLPGPAEIWANEHVSPPTVNISDALDRHAGVYIDGGHTNEEGARLVAERIWIEIEPTIRSYYG